MDPGLFLGREARIMSIPKGIDFSSFAIIGCMADRFVTDIPLQPYHHSMKVLKSQV